MEDEAEEIEEEELEEIDEYTDKDYEVTYRQRMIEDKIRMMRSRTRRSRTTVTPIKVSLNIL